MPETSKQDILLKDIAIILSQVTTLSNKYKDLSHQKSELESEVETEIENIKKQNHTEIFNSLDEEEREDLKSKITNLISKIDLHISS